MCDTNPKPTYQTNEVLQGGRRRVSFRDVPNGALHTWGSSTLMRLQPLSQHLVTRIKNGEPTALSVDLKTGEIGFMEPNSGFLCELVPSATIKSP